jgi:toxin ParE1/3/4
MASVVYSPAAEADVVEIAAFIARDKPDAARTWVDMLRNRIEALANHPQVGEERLGFGVSGCRSFSVGAYIIFFRSIADGIEVARVIHGSRDLRSL